MRSKISICQFLFFVVPLTAVSGTVCAQNTFPATGNVGIGTSSPAVPLDVRGLSNFSQQICSPKGLRLGSTATDLVNGATWYGLGVDTLQSQKSYIQLAGFYGLNLQTGAGQLVITNGGNVGIGTISPTQKLSVDGNINAKEVIVATSGWPDYVFNEGYKLPSLETLSEQIKTEGHLPDVPSAAQVEQKGLSLGAINKLQQQKIEELTLYLIEQDKQLKACLKENEKTRDELKQVQTEITELKLELNREKNNTRQ